MPILSRPVEIHPIWIARATAQSPSSENIDFEIKRRAGHRGRRDNVSA